MNTRLLAAGAVTVAALTVGGGVAFATQNAEPEIKGSVAAPQESGAESDAAENQNLEKLTKIENGAAEDAALSAVPGEVRETELEDEGGSVVYEVAVAGDDGKFYEVVVDAGNGDVLAQETEDDGPESADSEDEGRDDLDDDSPDDDGTEDDD